MIRLIVVVFSLFVFCGCTLPVSKYVRVSPVDTTAKLKPRSVLVEKDQKHYDRLYHNHIVVKFADPVPVHLIGGIQGRIAMERRLVAYQAYQTDRDIKKMSELGIDEEIISKEIALLNQILKNPNVVRFTPLFSRYGSDLVRERKEAEELSGEEMADLNNYYHVTAKDVSTADSIMDMFRSLKIVETSYFPPIPQNADITPPTPSYQGSQTYLNPAPNGIDAQAAWNTQGGSGSGIRIVDIEVGWALNHEDLPRPFFIDGNWTDDDDGVNHGTAVLGELVARNDGQGITGIAYQSRYGVVSVVRLSLPEFEPEPHYACVADSINIAASQLGAGDIILIEQHAPWAFPPGNTAFACQCNCEQFQYLPVEYWQAEYDAIRNATSRGVIVVEAAGNGSQDLDNSMFNNRFNRSVRDSGAIMVGAGRVRKTVVNNNDVLTAVLDAACFTNYGGRVDVQAWGENVWTLGYGEIKIDGDDKRQWYTRSFGGTSSASPIVAGAIACIQGARVASGNTPLAFLDMRNLLVSTGTPQTGSKHIGPQPNLAAALSSLQSNPIPSYGRCSVPSEQSQECGGAACRIKTKRFCWDECLFGIPGLLCEQECLLQYLDEYECANR